MIRASVERGANGIADHLTLRYAVQGAVQFQLGEQLRAEVTFNCDVFVVGAHSAFPFRVTGWDCR